MSEDWPVLLSLFPDNWMELASQTNALKNLRKDRDVENYLRTLLLHVGCGYSLRETTTRAKLNGLADISDVALLGRLKKSKQWFRELCIELFMEQGIPRNISGNSVNIRLFDATTVKEPGPTGSLWRLHFSIQLPSINCDYFKLSPTKGRGNGESFSNYSIRKNDYIIADRGYSTPSGICHVHSKQAYVLVRVNTNALRFTNDKDENIDLLCIIGEIKRAGVIRSWDVKIRDKKERVVEGRLCVIKKSNEAIKIAHKKIKRKASKEGRKLKEETLEYAKYIILFTTFPKEQFKNTDIFEWYRCRWQVELVFKRFKSIAELGHLPKHNLESSKAWLYGKLFVALLTNKLINYAESFSPWGYILERNSTTERLA